MLRSLTGAVVLLLVASCPAQKIGFVNLNKILESWNVVQNFEKEVNARIAKTQTEIDTLTEEIKALSQQIDDELQVHPPQSPEIQNLKRDRRQKLARLKATRDFNLVDLRRQVNDKTLRFYQDAVKKIQEYAQRGGYDLILKISDPAMEAEDQTTLKLKISYQTVVWHTAGADLTDAILAELNK